MKTMDAIRMIVFDWAGTTVDYGSSAPAEVFDRVFTAEGIHLTREEINKPMGLEKKAHIRSLLESPSGSSQWEKVHGAAWTEEDVERLCESFEKVLYQVGAEDSGPTGHAAAPAEGDSRVVVGAVCLEP